MYADIIVNLSVEELDRSFQYSIPDRLLDKVRPGTPVIVPFGQGSRTINGYVVGIGEQPKIAPERIKPILSIRDRENPIEGRLIELAWWIKEQFGSTMNEALKCVIPIKKQVREVVKRTIMLKVPEEEAYDILAKAKKRGFVAQERFFTALIEDKELDYDLTVHKLNITPAFIRRFEEDGTILVRSVTAYRNPVFNADRSGYKPPELNEAQRRIADSIKADMRSGRRCDYLIHGITGSGKTEVYMSVIDEVIASGRQVIMLIPEIALTYQTVKRFYLRYGERISIMNSRLSAGERYDQYLRAGRGETDIVIGPRSALFMPFEKLGLIIIDEEHESSYKSESTPRYSAREVALKRAQMENASVILGSATPSLESYSDALAGRIKLFSLEHRAGDAAMPDVHIVDMREELKAKNRTIFSRQLRELISDRLSKHEQVMLFLNRRGYSGFVSCRVCGHVIKCPHCDVSLTKHANGDLMCHYCGYTVSNVSTCPSCGSGMIGSFGIGTQKVEELINKEFPTARVLRMDADTTRTKESYDEILSRFSNEEADILVGTQMIVKGHDFHKVTLVGILLADMSLYTSDFRAGERTFQILTQASGRAGRGSLKGDVVIQTYNPGHYAVVHAADADYEGFFREEFEYRSMMKYPPAEAMLSILTLDRDEQASLNKAERLVSFIRTGFKEGSGSFRIIGPAPGSPSKANDLYRYIIYVKCPDQSLLVNIKDAVFESFMQDGSDSSIQFNFNR